MRFSGWALLFFAFTSNAQAADPDELVSKGIALRKERHDAEALALFREAYAIQPAARTRAQIGLAELALGKFLEAEVDLKGALAAAADPWIAKNGDALRTALTTVEDHLAWVKVTTSAGAEVRIDGRLVGSAPLEGPVRVVAGTVRVEVSREGVLPARREVDAAPGQKVELTLDAPLPAPKPAPVAKPEYAAQVPTTKYLGVGLIGFGVAAIGAGSYFGVRALHENSVRHDHCGDNDCDPDGLIADRRTRDFSSLATIGFITGVVSAGVGIFLVRTSQITISAQATGSSGRVLFAGAF